MKMLKYQKVLKIVDFKYVQKMNTRRMRCVHNIDCKNRICIFLTYPKSHYDKVECLWMLYSAIFSWLNK